MPWTLVTGAARGLGAATALYLAQKGRSVVIHFNTSQDEAESVAERCRVFGVDAETIQGDFSTSSSTEDFIGRYLKAFPDTQNVVYNVGNYAVKSALETSAEEWNALFQTNLHAALQVCKGLLPSIIKEKGSIVMIGSAGLERQVADTYSPAYTITKMGLHALMKSLAKEVSQHHVRVNMVSPGHLENSVDIPGDFSKLPFGRPGTLEEVARVVDFFLDPSSGYITGQNVEVAGAVRL